MLFRIASRGSNIGGFWSQHRLKLVVNWKSCLESKLSQMVPLKMTFVLHTPWCTAYTTVEVEQGMYTCHSSRTAPWPTIVAVTLSGQNCTLATVNLRVIFQ